MHWPEDMLSPCHAQAACAAWRRAVLVVQGEALPVMELAEREGLADELRAARALLEAALSSLANLAAADAPATQ